MTLIIAVLIAWSVTLVSAAAGSAMGSTRAPCGSRPDALEESLQLGLDELYNMHFETATRICERIITEHPTEPGGYLLQGIIHFYRHACGFRSPELKKQIVSSNHKAISLAREAKSATTSKTELLFYSGAAYGNLALFYGAESDWLKAVRYGRRARDLHREVITRDSTYYDALVAPGLYNYYGAALPKIVSFLSRLAGFGGDREKGLQQLRLAAEHGDFARVEAASFLADFYIEQGNYEAAYGIYARLSATYPDNPYYLLDCAHVRFRQQRYRAADSLLTQAEAVCEPELQHARSLLNYHRGRVEMIKNEYAGAAAHFREAAQAVEDTRRIELYDGWLLGDVYFYLAECHEFLGRPDSARYYYEHARAAEFASSGVVEGSKNRIAHPRSELELELVRATNSLLWRTSDDTVDDYFALRDSLAQIDGFADFAPFWHYHAGLAFKRLQLYENARLLLESVVHTEAEELKWDWLMPFAHYELASILFKLERSDQARTHIEIAKQPHGYHEEARLRYLIMALQRRLIVKPDEPVPRNSR